MQLLQDTIEAIAYGVTELHSKATQDAYMIGYWEGYNDGEDDAFDCLDTDQGDEDVAPFLSEDFFASTTARQTAEQDAEEQETLSAAADAYYDPFTRDVDYEGFLKDLPKAEPAPKYKVGDKVRLVGNIDEEMGIKYDAPGTIGTVVDASPESCEVETETTKAWALTPRTWIVNNEFLELVPSVIEAGTKVRVKTGVNIIDSQLVQGRQGFVIEVTADERYVKTGQTVLVGFHGDAIQRPDKTYSYTWWLSPEALEVVA